MSENVKLNKDKFDILFRKMMNTPPLPKDQVRTPRSKPKKGKKLAA